MVRLLMCLFLSEAGTAERSRAATYRFMSILRFWNQIWELPT
jgi:hypothetical protein